MLYFDTSFLTPLLLEEETSERVENYAIRQPAGELYISHWTRVEFASLIAREVRMGGLSVRDATKVIDQFEEMVEESCRVLLPTAADYELAKVLLATFSAGLRSGDALHLAIAKNHGADKILSLDSGLLKAAKVLGIHASRGIR